MPANMIYRRGMGEAANSPAAPPPAGQQFYYEAGTLLFQRTLTALQALQDLVINNDRDADFFWSGIWGTKTGNYKLRFRFPNGRYHTSTQVQDRNIVGTAQFPVPMRPVVEVIQNGGIRLDITDLLNANNDVELVLGGVFRYPVGR